MAGNLKRAMPGGSPQTLASTSMMGASGLQQSGTDIFFIDGSNAIRRYDAQAGMLDATSYGSLAGGTGMGMLIGSSGTTILWANSPNTGQPFTIWKATDGSPGTATSLTIPSNAMLSSLGAGGTKVAVTASASGMTNVVTLDTANQGAGPTTIAMFSAQQGGGGGGGTYFVYDGGALFTTSSGTTQTGTVLKIALADGTQTTIGHDLAEGGTRPLAVTSSFVYVLEPGQTGPQLSRWMRP
jgi:hypothetical protein